MKTSSIIKYSLALIGSIFLVISIYLAWETKSFVNSASLATGQIIGFDQKEVSHTSNNSQRNTSYIYYPRVLFISNEKTTHTFTTKSGSSSPGYEYGEQVEVYYSLEKPQNAKINGFFSLWGTAFIFFMLGSTFSAISAALFYFLT